MNHITPQHWSAPGSLLIAGEYLITEEGGCGVALAAGGRSYLESELSKRGVPGDSDLKMEGYWPNGGEKWSPQDGDSPTLAAAVWKQCRNSGHGTKGEGNAVSGRMVVDTSEFYDKRGRKLGFGSSAAAALLYSRGLLYSAPAKSLQPADCALRAHSSWQGGRGSGYDVLTSAYGGAGRFTGGVQPKWDTLSWPDDSESPRILESWLIKGAEAVKSPDAVSRFQRWQNSKKNSYHLISEISEITENLSNLLLGGMDSTPGKILESIHRLAISGIQLGEEIGVPAKPLIPGVPDIPLYRRGSLALKCLGAGNESILLLFIPGGLSSDEIKSLKGLQERGLAVPLKVEHEGLRSELHPGEHK
ncbi:MAG: hypothetical protein DRP70_03670 [Spirochaetes bacterium]|nr:MAG: hypothetical protein DRP70_03670 [Spirochaetota bacterium]RKX97301.1 MAG: hypothetical protein DRZ90_06685 [Spirochaetota bacterium]